MLYWTIMCNSKYHQLSTNSKVLTSQKNFLVHPLGSQKLNEESGLPVFLENVAAFLLKNDALNVEGIFRIPGNAKGIDAYIRRIESGESKKHI